MYKIYIGEYPVYLSNHPPKVENNMLIIYYNENKAALLQVIQQIEQQLLEGIGLWLWHESLTLLREDFFSHYKIHKAGGGVVTNTQKKILAIQRMGYWDLPKGKEEAGETMAITAIREVREETGIQNLTLGHFISETFHTYNNRKGKRCIKWSFWYQMSSDDIHFVPQAEEDIEAVLWIEKDTLLQQKPIYKNIIDILNQL